MERRWIKLETGSIDDEGHMHGELSKDDLRGWNRWNVWATYGNVVHTRGVFTWNMARVWTMFPYVGHMNVKYGPRMNDVSIRGPYAHGMWPVYE